MFTVVLSLHLTHLLFMLFFGVNKGCGKWRFVYANLITGFLLFAFLQAFLSTNAFKAVFAILPVFSIGIIVIYRYIELRLVQIIFNGGIVIKRAITYVFFPLDPEVRFRYHHHNPVICRLPWGGPSYHFSPPCISYKAGR